MMDGDFKNISKKHIVYALMFQGKPIYVGCCMNLKQRESAHRRLKTFDYAIVIKTYSNKLDALMCENAIIRFISLFSEDFVNAPYADIVMQKDTKESYLKSESEVLNV